jgi:hypothetical protein
VDIFFCHSTSSSLLFDGKTKERENLSANIEQIGVFVQGRTEERIKAKIGDLWESPLLHVLLTKEDDVVVARCLDFTVSSHGEDQKDALKSLADSIKEYVLTALESKGINTIFDPAHGKYWRMYNELEAK